MDKDKYLKLVEQYAWQFKLLDDVFDKIYRRSQIIVDYYIEHFDDFLKLEFEEYDDEKSTRENTIFKKTDMLSWLKKNYYKKYLNKPKKLLRELEVDWANVLATDYYNSYSAAVRALPKELQELHRSIE